MSLYEFDYAIRLLRYEPPFYGLIMAAMLKASTNNALKLKNMWPEVWEELSLRYHSPGGLLEGETRHSDEPRIEGDNHQSNDIPPNGAPV